MSLNDLGEKVEKSINVEIGNKYYYQLGKSGDYNIVTVTGKRFYPDDRTDNGFIYTNPTNTVAVGKVIDPLEINKFFRISTRKYDEKEYNEQKNHSEHAIFEQVKPTLIEDLDILSKTDLAHVNNFPIVSGTPMPIPVSPEEHILPVSFHDKLPFKNILSPVPESVNFKQIKNLLR